MCAGFSLAYIFHFFHFILFLDSFFLLTSFHHPLPSLFSFPLSLLALLSSSSPRLLSFIRRLTLLFYFLFPFPHLLVSFASYPTFTFPSFLPFPLCFLPPPLLIFFFFLLLRPSGMQSCDLVSKNTQSCSSTGSLTHTHLKLVVR